MKTLVVFSDTHGKRSAIGRLSHLFGENDFLVHLGDGAADMRDTRVQYPEKCVVLRGNCDMGGLGEEERVLEVEGVKILCCHGHKYGVKSSLTRLWLRAKELGCTVALYGHTHRAAVDEQEGVLCVNPGALGAYLEPSYCYLVVSGKKAVATIVPLGAAPAE